MLSTRKKINAIIAALEDVKAMDVVTIDTRKKSPLFEYIIIASATSARQTRALANNVSVELKKLGAEILGVEGEDSGEWVLVDLGEVVVHIMQPAVRAYYNLEELWNTRSLPLKAAARPE